ncbi:MAG: VWA domain-containing protein [Myxococcales bacterium]|nr:VWA domain-containing protein [Sorangiineae bacterium PRO1]MCL4752474.1 VWA domain-containing protein [Myxococcales bacterium]
MTPPKAPPSPRRPGPRAPGPRSRLWQRIGVVTLALIGALGAGIAYPAIARGPELLNASWQNWWFLPLLVLVPLVFWRATWGEDRRTPRLRVGTLLPFTLGPVGWHVWLRDVPGVFRSVGVGLFILALARPINTLHPEITDERGIDIVLVLDLSGSMQAVIDNVPENLQKFMPRERDRRIRPTRLDVAKAVIRDFISRRKTDRIGVVVFGKEAYVLSPPTLDYHLLDALVSKMELKLIDGSATAIGDATGVAVARLRRSQARSKAVMLLTDGDNNAGQISPEYSAHLAKLVGAKLFTIQIGSGEVAEVQDGFDLFGQPRYVTVPFPVNPELLKKLAEETGGETYVASDATKLQESFHDVLDKLEKTRFEASIASFEDMYRFLLLPGVLLIALDAILRALLLRRFP